MRGLDLCCQQGAINWAYVKSDGIDFIIPRTGWGTDCDGDQIDPAFLYNVSEALKAGIKVSGVYHFVYAVNTAEVIENAKCAIRAVEQAGLPKSTVIWADIEEDTIQNARKRGVSLSNADLRKFAETFCDYCLQQGYCTGIYLNADYLVNRYGKDIAGKYDIWFADPYLQFSYDCLIKQDGWAGQIRGIPKACDTDIWIGTYTAGTAKPKETKTMSKVDAFIAALATLGDGRYHYYDGSASGIGCSEYTRQALIKAGIIGSMEYFHAGNSNPGVLTDTTRFQRIPWDPSVLKKGDILWSQGHHVATWDGKSGVYEAAPESTHGICDNGRTGVGHWSQHGYRNCGTGTYSWTCIYRIIDVDDIKEEIKKEIKMDKTFNAETLAKYMPVIRSGKTGDMVTALQLIMQKYGWYSGTIDGSCGPMTVAGIKSLQTAIGVDADGSFGPKSWTALLK